MDYPLVASIGGKKRLNRADGQAIQRLDAALMTSRIQVPAAPATRDKAPRLKYLVIGSLIALVLLLIYSRLRPYLQLIRKVVSAINSSPAVVSPGSSQQRIEHKLIRCESCKTWIPSDRAIGSRSGRPGFCSTECFEKGAAEKTRKLAG